MTRPIAVPGLLVVAALISAALIVSACAPTPTRRERATAADLLANQRTREAALAAEPDWSLSARLGVANDRDSGSGALDWQMHGDGRYRFTVHAPVTGKTWRLQGDAGHAVLEGLREQPIEGDDAAGLLLRELGWRVPVSQLTFWVRGARASADARIAFRNDGLPSSIDEAGWHVEYPDYDKGRVPPLPTRVFASSGAYKVRLAIGAWKDE